MNETNPPINQVSEARFAVEPEVTFERRDVGGETTYLAHHRGLDRYFQMGPAEYRVITLLDGTRSIQQVTDQLRLDGIHWSPNDVITLIKQFASSRIVSSIGSASPDPSDPSPTSFVAAMPQLLSWAISQRIPLVAFDTLSGKLCRALGFAFSVPGMLIWGLFVASGLAVVAGNQEQLQHEVSRLFDGGTWWVMLVIWVVVKFFHECGHAVSAKYHGVRVGKAGILFFMFAPLAYVDVTDAWRLSHRWKRVQIAMSGVYVELAIASVAAWIWWYLPNGYLGHLAAQTFLVAGPATLLVNANPLLRLDGYYVLSDLTGIPNLRMHGRRQIGNVVNQAMVGIPSQGTLLAGWRRPFATAHAVCSVLFQLVWMTGLVLGIAWWAKGLGLAIAAIAILLWCVLPLTGWAIQVWNHRTDRPFLLNPQRRRLVIWGLLGVITGSYLVTAPSPLRRHVPVVVQFHKAQSVRSASDAFIHKVHISRGERVLSGDLLIELSSPQLQLERDMKADELRETQLRVIQHRRAGETSLATSETEKAKSLSRQLVELEQMIDSLAVYARRDGLVVSDAIESFEGRFVAEGTELLRVCDPQDKELVIAVSPNNIEAFERASHAGAPLAVRLRGGEKFTTIPSPLRPRATFSLPHPAMGANCGGPIPVEPAPSDEADSMGGIRPIEAQMKSITRLDTITSTEVKAGQLGMMALADNRPLITRLIEHFRR